MWSAELEFEFKLNPDPENERQLKSTAGGAVRHFIFVDVRRMAVLISFGNRSLNVMLGLLSDQFAWTRRTCISVKQPLLTHGQTFHASVRHHPPSFGVNINK